MESVSYSLIDDIKFYINVGYDLDQISYLVNLDKNYVIYLVKKIRNNIIKECNNDEFYLVLIIDKLLDKKLKNVNKFVYSQQYEIIKLFPLSDDEIMDKLNINLRTYINFLKNMYFSLSIYDIHGVDKSFLGIIKERLDNINYIESIKQHKLNIKEFNGCCDVELFDKTHSVINLDCGKVYDMGNSDMKFIVISDTHFGAIYERMAYLDCVYDYAIKNNIKYIVLTGDLIEGSVFSFDRCKSKYKSIESQVEHVINDYCYDSSIKNIILLGNHDFNSIYKNGIDISKCFDSRKDFDILGYKECYLKFGDEFVTLKHEVSKILSSFGNPNTFLSFVGHSHQYRCNYDSDIIFKVPAMCDAPVRNDYVINRGFLVCDLSFDSLGLSNVQTEFIEFDKNDRVIFERKLR